MKKLAITIVIVLGLGISAFADGGLFQRGYNAKNGLAASSNVDTTPRTAFRAITISARESWATRKKCLSPL